MSITVPSDSPGFSKVKVGDVVTVKLKVSELTDAGIACEIVPAEVTKKKTSVLDYLKSVNKKPITPTPKLPI